MPVRLTDRRHGHVAIFYADSANPSSSADISWGPASIEIPPSSSLNGPADVWLQLPSVPPHRAANWCRRANTLYLGQWSAPDNCSLGFGFRVSHFSRYGFVDSDDEETNPDIASNPASDPDQRPQPATTAAKQRPSARDARILRAGSTPARTNPRLHRAGSTPARPRAGRSSAQPAEQQPDSTKPVPADQPDTAATSQRPRMSTRAIADLDDTDLDIEDDDETYHTEDLQTHSPNNRSFDPQYAAEQVPPNQQSFSAQSHRTITFQDDVENFQPLQRWPTSMGVDAPNLHRLREVLFTPHQSPSTTAKFERSLQDMDMPDNTSPIHAEAMEEEAVDAAAQQRQFDFDPEEEAEREAHDFAPDEEQDAQLVANSYPSSVLPFPILDDSVAGGKQDLFTAPALVLGRSMRICFSGTGVVLAPMFHASKGFTVGVRHTHDSVVPLPRPSFAKMLAPHCAVWYGSIPAMADTMADTIGSPMRGEAANGNEKRKVRAPTLAAAFRSGTIANGVIEQIITMLHVLYDDGSDPNALHAISAFGILLALYKSEDGDARFDAVRPQLLKRLADWAAGPSGTSFDDGIDSISGLRKAVVLLSLGRVDDAVDVAIAQGHLRLATMMARALEAPKDQLRRDAMAQLEMYGLIVMGEMEDDLKERKIDAPNGECDDILQLCRPDAQVSVDERMILLILGGHVSPVARYLDFSWYRLFIMELLHGAGSSDGEQWQRVARAVSAVPHSEISTFAPHGETEEIDVVYQLLRLYAEDVDKHGLTSGIYCNSTIGSLHQPMDYRFTWLLHQALTALIPEASPKDAGISLANGLSSQLRGCGRPLWAFYVLCCGGASEGILKEVLIRDWPEMQDDFVGVKVNNGVMEVREKGEGMDDEEMDSNSDEQDDIFTDAEEFLIDILRVPHAWVCEAKAVAARVEGNRMDECTHWMDCGDDRGRKWCHDVLMKDVVPKAIIANDMECLKRIGLILSKLEEMDCIANWSWNGGLVLGYLRYIVGVPQLFNGEFATLRELAAYVGKYVGSGRCDVERCAGTVIADGVVTAQRALLLRAGAEEREEWFTGILTDLENVPCSRSVRLRLSGEYTIVAMHGWPDAQRIAAAFPAYRKFVDNAHSVGEQRNV